MTLIDITDIKRIITISVISVHWPPAAHAFGEMLNRFGYANKKLDQSIIFGHFSMAP